ncbi:MAG: TonB-dependent receptor [Acidobacteria bacterium]|nr:TonB-dependent receptor [Acidobacteriota bacterium]
MNRRWWLATCLLLVAASAGLAQQPTTGTLQGVVTDQEGNPLPGATVSLTGPLGQRGAQTDTQGLFEFRFISPGSYTVRVEMEGYATVEIAKVEVNVGARTRLPVTLLPGQTEEVTVTSAAPLMDPKRLEVVTNFKTDQSIETMPIGRNFTEAIQFAPGVVSGIATGEGNYSIGGASGLENAYIIDGVNITDSGYGGVGSYSIIHGSLGTGITTDFLEEIQVKTAGFEAEFGQALGGVVNGVVKSGTNELAGSVRAYVSPGSWTAFGKGAANRTGTLAVNTHEREETDLGVSAGGPIVKDRLFWFAAYNPVTTKKLVTIERTTNPILGLDPATSAEYAQANPFPASARGGREVERDRNNYAAKVNWLATPNHRFELTAFGDPSDGDGRSGVLASPLHLVGANVTKSPASFADGGRASDLDYGADQQSIRYNGLFGSNWFLEAQVSHRENEFNETSVVNDWQYTDLRIQREWAFGGTLAYPVIPTAGGAGFIGPTSDKTWDYSAKLSTTVGSHELKAGVQYFDLEYTQPSVYSGPQVEFPFPADRDGDGNVDDEPLIVRSTSGALVQLRGGIPSCTACAFSVGNPEFRVTRARFNPAEDPVTGTETALFLQDTWTLNERWVIKLGVRTSSQELKGSGSFTLPFTAVPQPAGNFLFTDEPSTYAPNQYKFKTEYSPRIGISFDPFANGKTKLYANAARYFERVPADLAVRQFSNEVGTSRFTFADPDLTQRLSNVVLMQGLQPGTVAGGTRLPYEDELVLGWQQLVRPDLSLEVRGIYRDQGRALEDVQFASIEEIQNFYYGDPDEDGTLELPFPGFGAAPFGAYVLANPGENTEGSFTKPEREYKALEFSLNKRLSNNWQLMANYRYSRLRGNYEGLFRNDNGQSDPNITSLFDFPNSPLMRGQYQAGPLNTDRPHVLNLVGTYFFENGFEIGGALQWQSGVPRTPLLAHPNYQNSGELPGQDPLYLSFDPASDQWVLGAQGDFLGTYTDSPRGSLGRSPDIATIDAHFGWQHPIRDTRLKLTLDVFNIFNNQDPITIQNNVEFTAGVPDSTFNKVISIEPLPGYQEPRSVRAAAIWDW